MMDFFKGLGIAIVLSFLLWSPIVAVAQSWRPADQATVQWDAVAVPSGSTIEYRVYTRTNSQGAGEGIVAAVVGIPSATVQFSIEGRYFVGVQSVRKVGGAEVASSGISWSDVPAVCQGGNTFGVVYYIPPAAPMGLR